MHVGLASALAAEAELTIVVRYGGSPRPIGSLWGAIGFEELSDGVLVAGQPHGAASWFPCDDHPSAKASYRIRVSTESPYTVIANGALVSRQARVAQTVWTYEQPEPTSTLPGHPADRHVRDGPTGRRAGVDTGRPARAAAAQLRPRLRAAAGNDEAVHRSVQRASSAP